MKFPELWLLREKQVPFNLRGNYTFLYERKGDFKWEIAKDLHLLRKEKVIVEEMAHSYLDYKDTKMARFVLDQVKNIKEYDDPSFTNNVWARYYKMEDKQDSAAYFYQKALKTGNVYVKRRASRELYLMEHKKKIIRKLTVICDCM